MISARKWRQRTIRQEVEIHRMEVQGKTTIIINNKFHNVRGILSLDNIYFIASVADLCKGKDAFQSVGCYFVVFFLFIVLSCLLYESILPVSFVAV